MVDLHLSKVICWVGDEQRILPKRIRNSLEPALQLVTTRSTEGGSRNLLVSETFMRMFLEVCGHYRNHIIVEKEEKSFAVSCEVS